VSFGLHVASIDGVRRVSVIGSAGAGKSTLSRRLAHLLDCPWVELDGVYHQAGWTRLGPAELRQRVAALASGDSWVIDGNYSATSPVVWPRADTVIWLDLPKGTIMRRVIWRTIRRLICRTELWNGNRERWQHMITWDQADSVISRAWHKHGEYRELFAAAAADPVNDHLRFVRMTSPGAVRRFMQDIEKRVTANRIRNAV
jgi:adenylate kinase family enzyme